MPMMSHVKHILIPLVLSIFPLLSYADSATASKADSLFMLKEYSKALSLYKQLQSEQQSITVDQLLRLAICTTEGSNNQQQAANLFSKLTEYPIAPVETWYYLGLANQRMYKLEDATDYYNIFLSKAKEDNELTTQAELQINSCENGMQMLDYATRISSIAKQQVPAVNFFDLYDTFSGIRIVEKPQAMWMSADSLVEDKNTLGNIIFLPEEGLERDSDVIYFASYGQDKETGLDIFRIKRIEGSSWGEPEEVVAINSPFDEVLPYITADGTTLYFASNGHYGMGGFDIYKSEYSTTTRTWSTPENLGFPISSPYDDILFVPDAANRTACFASSRDTNNNNDVMVYKIQMSVNPERISVSSTNEIMAMASFNVNFGKDNSISADSQGVDLPIKELANNESYVLLVNGTTNLSKKLSEQQLSLNNLRQQMSYVSQDSKKELEQKIVKGEQELDFTQTTFNEVQSLLSSAELEYFTNGIEPSIPEEFKATLNKVASTQLKHETAENQSAAFGNTILTLESAPTLTMKPPKLSESDKYRFRTTGKSIIIPNDPIPAKGVIYKIRIGILTKTLTDEQLKNLSPVTTEKRGTTTRYYIGVFKTYSDALKALSEIKKKGFKDALIDAWVNGKSEVVSKAKNAEKQAIQKHTSSSTKPKPGSKSMVYRVSATAFGDTASNIPTIMNPLSGGRDISKKVNADGSITYSVGVFTKKTEADEIKSKLEAEGISSAEVSEIEVNN